jgi:hypothetical protein
MASLRRFQTIFLVAACVLAWGCEEPDAGQPGLPDPQEVEEWFGEGTDVELEGNLLVVRGTIGTDYLQRGGRIWARSGPYFYLFNVKVQELMVAYPDLAGVRATAVAEDGRQLATALLRRNALNELRWDEALRRATLAQTQGTDNPRYVERLIQFGEDYTEYEYTDG